jgi:hypothetical protein
MHYVLGSNTPGAASSTADDGKRAEGVIGVEVQASASVGRESEGGGQRDCWAGTACGGFWRI